MFLPQPNDSNFVPPPPGTHPAICYRFIDIGSQVSEWNGERKTQHKVIISWELPTELMEDGRPFSVTRRYTWSMGEKANLRHDLEAWRGKAFADADFAGPNRFDVKNILGKCCLLTIVHETGKNGNTYANIKGVAALPKGMQQPQPVNAQIYLSLEPDRFSRAVLEGLSETLQKLIKETPEYNQIMRGNGASMPEEREYFNDDVPF